MDLTVQSTRIRSAALSVAFLLTSSIQITTVAQAEELRADGLDIDVAGSSIEQLLAMDVSSVSKASQDYFTAPAAVYVLTGEQIRRSGVRTLPEALRLVPGVQVSRIDANKWSVTIRGFGNRVANKLLVLIDGRSVYDPLFAGVFWENRSVMIEDLERIEVVRGPGGTLWGANAVNGVINIVSKRASETQGALVSGGGGTEERAFGSARYGVTLSDSTYFRAFSTYRERDGGELDGNGTDDSQRYGSAGFRLDREGEGTDILTLQGSAYDGRESNFDDAAVSETDSFGGNIILRGNHSVTKESKFSFISYFDHTSYEPDDARQVRNTGFAELQHEWNYHPQHRLVSGVSYSLTDDDISVANGVVVEPTDRTNHIASAYLEDQFTVIENVLEVTGGAKLEWNEYTDLEVQPTIRFSWLVQEDNVIWGRVARAVRVPSRLENDLRAAVGPDRLFTGNRSLDAEEVMAYELGYNTKLRHDLLLATTTFINHYSDLITVEDLTFGNTTDGETYGFEANLKWQVKPSWSLEASYTYLEMDLSTDSASQSARDAASLIEDSDPSNIVTVQSLLDLGGSWQFDATGQFVDGIPALGVGSYFNATLRLGYWVTENLELSVVGHDLIEDHHFEQSGNGATEVQRGVYGKVLWKF